MAGNRLSTPVKYILALVYCTSSVHLNLLLIAEVVSQLLLPADEDCGRDGGGGKVDLIAPTLVVKFKYGSLPFNLRT